MKKQTLAYTAVLLIVFAFITGCNLGTPDGSGIVGTPDEETASKQFSLEGAVGIDAVRPGALRGPEDLMISGDRLWVVDTDNHRVNVYDLAGNFQFTLQGPNGPFQERDAGGFVYPRAIASDASGNIYVLDTQNERVQVFTPSGTFLREFGSDGSADGQFDFPYDIDLDDDGNIYVADTNNNRIQKFNNSGSFIASWTTVDESNVSFEPRYVEIHNDRVYTGSYLLLDGPVSYALNGSDYRAETEGFWISSVDGYEVDDSNQTIDVYTNGALDFTISPTAMDLSDVEKVISDAAGNFYLLETDQYRIRKIDADGNLLLTIGSDREAVNELYEPKYMDFDSAGNLYVADSRHHRVQVLDANLNFAGTIGGYGEYGDVDRTPFPGGCGYSIKNNTIVTKDQDSVKEFALDGSFVRAIQDPTDSMGAVMATADGTVFVSNKPGFESLPIMTVYPDSGAEFTWNIKEGTDETDLFYPSGMTIDDEGNVVIAGKLNGALKIYTPEGGHVRTIDLGSDIYPMDITRDEDGNYYVSNNQVTNLRPAVRVYDSQFRVLGEFGYRGAGQGEFMTPIAVRVDSSGIIYVSDSDRSDIQMFSMSDISQAASRSINPGAPEIILPDEEKGEL